MKYDVVSYTESETKLLDSLADGQWHPSYKIWKEMNEWAKQQQFARDQKYTRETMAAELAALAEDGVLLSGSNESYRFVTSEMERWRLLSPTLDREDVKNQPRYFGGILEDDGWSKAPLHTCHLVHFKVGGNVTRDRLANLLEVKPTEVSVNEDGLYKIYAEENSDLYDRVKKLKELAPEAKISGIRLEANLKRRNVADLPKRYYSDLCNHYGNFARKVLLRGMMSSITKHLPDPGDQSQQIYIWVIEAIKRYDDSTAIPFAAYLGTSLTKWVYDLNRKAYGRSIADIELKYTRAVTTFKTREMREPTTAELAEELDMSVEEVEKARDNINTVVNLRNQKALDYEDYEIPVPAHEVTDKGIEDLIEANILSASITTASREDNGKRNLIGLVGLYHQTWGAGVEDKRIKSWLRGKSVTDAVVRLSEKAGKIIRASRHEG